MGGAFSSKQKAQHTTGTAAPPPPPGLLVPPLQIVTVDEHGIGIMRIRPKSLFDMLKVGAGRCRAVRCGAVLCCCAAVVLQRLCVAVPGFRGRAGRWGGGRAASGRPNNEPAAAVPELLTCPYAGCCAAATL